MSAAIPPGLRAARHEFQRGLLEWLRNDAAGVLRMRRAVAAVAAGHGGALWRIVPAWLETLGAAGLDADGWRLCARIDAQLRALLRGSDAGAEELGRELLRRSDEPPAGGTILSTTIYDLYLAEARALLAVLEEQAPERAGSAAIEAARNLSEISATIDAAPIERLARALEQALTRLSGVDPDQASRMLLCRTVETLRAMTEAVAERGTVMAQAHLAAELDRLGA